MWALFHCGTLQVRALDRDTKSDRRWIATMATRFLPTVGVSASVESGQNQQNQLPPVSGCIVNIDAPVSL